MTPAPVPTPYDITEIPFFAFSPGMVWWIILIAILIVLGVVIARVPLRRARAVGPAISTALREIERIRKEVEDPKEKLAAASLVGRRFLTSATSINLRSATTDEIKRIIDRTPAPLAPLLLITAEIETRRFTPRVDSEIAETNLDELSKRLRRYQDDLTKVTPK